ncbi:asparagine synthase (glutamine-hydrolyzing) [uncultured Prevotella sp.]|uniref:asparagine synthase (glutamine-hydrolyzing) n=1 Tax=uncultured Prevotella sp. TaxID=159272 RepID=UPI002593933A|nr:asparagine synthase (glutamine-hydrolyzing) [uncultured Prevotella sp.]
MCGIYGTTFPYNREVIERKLELMKFRGPNYTGIKEFDVYPDIKLTLGHVRLSILDLDARSNQPFVYNNSIGIVFNGEVYNYKELTEQYLSDVTLRTTSDTEVICAMYEKFGMDCVNYLNGMFAYVIYDKNKNILTGARDRLGKKPFYYWFTNGGFEFASQIKVIKYGNDMQIDELARKFYVLQGYIPDPYCIFKGVKKLRAGEHFVYHLDSRELKINNYWNIFDNTCGFTAPKSFDEAKETVKDLLFDSVRMRLRADVPVGIFLSGGIDSSLTSAIVSKINKNICAYTIGFDNSRYDESKYAKAVAESLGIPIKVCMCVGSDQQQIFDDYINYFDEPFCDPSMIPSSLVAQKAKEDVTVVLGGDGGDELFFGYKKYEYILPRLEQYKKPYWLRKIASPLYLLKGGWQDMIFATQKDYADVFRSEGIFVYDFGGAEKFDRLLLAKQLPDREIFKKERGVLSYSDYDMKFFMNAVNQKVDRATMRCSLELRNPIMDYKIAEYSRLIPFEYLYTQELKLKSILKSILYDMVPRKLLERQKRGFTPPTSDWFRGPLKEKMLDVITENNVRELLPDLDVNKYISLRDEFISGKDMDARMFWSVYTYINWFEHYK